MFSEFEQSKFQYFNKQEKVKTEEKEQEEAKEDIQHNSPMVDYIFVVGFDHKIGSVIEYFYPEPDPEVLDDNSKKALSFIGLPDGSHATESDYSFFIVPDVKGNLYYGVSCFRQIRSSELEIKDENVSRSFVQKSV